MAIKSSLVTAKENSDDLGITMAKTVNSNDVTIDERAKAYVNAISGTYDAVITSFNTLGDLFGESKKHFRSSAMKKSMGKISVQCKNQAKHCKKRKNDVKDFFSMANEELMADQIESLLARVAALEAQNGGK